MSASGLGNFLLNAGIGSDEFGPLRSQLFGANEQGLWPRPDQFGSALTQYKESTGQSIVTAVGDTVGFAVDWRLGRTLGADVAINGNFSNGTTGWVDVVGSSGGALTIVSGRGRVTNTGSTEGRVYQAFTGLIVGRFYLIECDAFVGTANVSMGFTPNIDTTGGVATGATSSGRLSFIVPATATTMYLRLVANTAGIGLFAEYDNVTLRELPGNHAYQATASKRPLLAQVPAGGRRNNIIATEDATNAAWLPSLATFTNVTTTDENGDTVSAMRLAPTTDNTTHQVRQTGLQSQNYSWSALMKADGETQVSLWIDATRSGRFTLTGSGTVTTSGGNVAATIASLGNGWYLCQMNSTVAGTIANIYLRIGGAYVGNVNEAVLIRKPQCEPGTSRTNYQRVGAGIYDVTEVGQPTLYGWLTDGVDDNFETNAFDPATDKVTVCAGVRKLSDAITIITEFSTNVNTNNGSLFMTVSDSGTPTPGYSFASKGTARGLASIATGYAAPISNVVSGVGDISGDIARLRVNGTQVATSAIDQGTGNYGNHKAYIGGRAGTSLFYNGYIFALCLRFAATDSSLLSRLENFTAVKTLGAKL